MIHLIYPHQNKISAPNIIGYKLLNYLAQFDKVKPHDWDSYYQIKPSPGDILIGHLCPLPLTVMKRSLKNPGWKRKIILQPYNESLDYAPFLDEFVDLCDVFLAITGPYWFDRISDHPYFSRWYPKMMRVDLAVDPLQFPRIKEEFNRPGQRKFVYVGVDNKYKNLDYLEKIFERLPTFEIHSIGRISSNRKFIHHGFVNFKDEAAKRLIKEFDFLITVGNNDANPTTILEAMSWGLIPICTPTSGYFKEDGILNVPNNDDICAAKILQYYQYCTNEELVGIRKLSQDKLMQNYSWDIFYQKIYQTIYSNHNVSIEPRLQKIKKKYNFLWLFFIKSVLLNCKRFVLNMFN
jgi:glycosyltransferase involved in cell wall biosynthesis